jgi:hypothetical protein
MRKFGALLAGTALTAALTLPAFGSAVAAQAAPGGAVAFIATGTVTGSNGLPLPRTAVALYAWPADSVLHVLKDHAAVPRKLLATGRTGVHGRFTVRALRRGLRSVTQDGNVNAEIVSGTRSVFFAVALTTTTTTVVANVGDGDGGGGGGGGGSCGRWYFQRQAQKAWAIIGQSYIQATATHVTQTFDYRTGQVSALGVGISGSGKSRTFRSDGTSTEYAKWSIRFSTRHTGNMWYETRFRIGLYLRRCTGARKQYLIHADGWAGGAKTGHPAKAPATKTCTPISRGTTWVSGQQKAVTWPSGLKVTSVRFSGSARTGYDAKAEVSYKFNANRLLCGTQRKLASSQQFVVER